MNTMLYWVVGIVALAALAFFVLSGSQAETGTIKIGFSMPLSGEAASYGESGRAGAELAIKEINEAGGINGRMVEGVFEDDKCNPTGISAIQKLVAIDKVDVLVGPVCSGVAGGAIPVARAAGVPTIMIGAGAPGLAGGADSIFSDYPSDTFQGKFATEYMYDTMGVRKVAVLYVQNDWGQGLEKVFVKRFTELGGEVVYDEGAAQDATDVKSHIAKIKQANPDAVYFPVYPALAIVAAKQMKDLGLTVPVVGGDSLVAEEFVSSGYAEGVKIIIGSVADPAAFNAKVQEMSGIEPNIIAALSYDAVRIFAQVIEERGVAQSKIVAGLNDLTYTDGVSFKSISFDENGDLEGATYDVKVVKNSKVEIVK